MIIAALSILLVALIVWRVCFSPKVGEWRGDCPWCDGRGDWTCKHCIVGYVPWCQKMGDDGETVCAKCQGDGTNSMGEQCDDCPNILKS